MKFIKCKTYGKNTHKYYAVDDDIYDSVKGYNWREDINGYAVVDRYVGGKRKILLHRMITNVEKGMCVDHKNHSRTDNTLENLRICTYSENNINKKKIKSEMKYKGVYKKGKSFCSSITKNYKRYYLGIFKTEEEAANAYNEYALKLHGDFAYLNKID